MGSYIDADQCGGATPAPGTDGCGQLLGSNAGSGLVSGAKTYADYAPGRVFVEGVPYQTCTPVTTTRMVSETIIKKVPYTVSKCIPEEVVKSMPVTTTRMVRSEVQKCVPETITKIICETHVKQVPTKVTTCVPEQVTKMVAYKVCKEVPVTTICKVPVCVTEMCPVTVTRKVAVQVPVACATKSAYTPCSPCGDGCSAGCDPCKTEACDPCASSNGCSATGLADILKNRPTPVRDFLKGLFEGRLCADPCAPTVCDPCAAH